MIDAGEFDYVIAGGGTAGCVSRPASARTRRSRVCLIEAGPSDVDDEAILRARGLDVPARLGLRLGLPRRAAGEGQLVPAPRAREGARRLLVAQLVHRVLDAEGGSRRVGGDGLRGLELRRVLAADHQARDQRRPRRAPRTLGPGEHPHRAARRPVRRRAARGGGRRGTADVALQRGLHGHQRRRLVPDQLGAPTTRGCPPRTPTCTRSSARARTSRSGPAAGSSRVELRRGAPSAFGRVPDARPADAGERAGAPRGDPQRRRDRHAEAADAVGHRPRASTCASSASRRSSTRRGSARTSTTTSRGSSSGTRRSR